MTVEDPIFGWLAFAVRASLVSRCWWVFPCMLCAVYYRYELLHLQWYRYCSFYLEAMAIPPSPSSGLPTRIMYQQPAGTSVPSILSNSAAGSFFLKKWPYTVPVLYIFCCCNVAVLVLVVLQKMFYLLYGLV